MGQQWVWQGQPQAAARVDATTEAAAAASAARVEWGEAELANQRAGYEAERRGNVHRQASCWAAAIAVCAPAVVVAVADWVGQGIGAKRCQAGG